MGVRTTLPVAVVAALVASALVLIMTTPGRAIFYGGLVRDRNALAIYSQCVAVTCLVTLPWVLYGFSVAFGDAPVFTWACMTSSAA
jgi:Amt family ammonium transporter